MRPARAGLRKANLMPLSAPIIDRKLAHTRTITISGHERGDGLFDIEGHLVDVRPEAVTFAGGGRRAGEPIHVMWLRLTVDADALIVDVEAVTDAGPFGDACGAISPVYKGLVGLRVGAGFRGQVRRLLAGVRGCTHMTEMLLAMATVVIQTLAGSRPQPADERPFQLDGCHALAVDSPMVATFHPRWYRKRDTPSG